MLENGVSFLRTQFYRSNGFGTMQLDPLPFAVPYYLPCHRLTIAPRAALTNGASVIQKNFGIKRMLTVASVKKEFNLPAIFVSTLVWMYILTCETASSEGLSEIVLRIILQYHKSCLNYFSDFLFSVTTLSALNQIPFLNFPETTLGLSD